jgi:hypothetical protein
MLQIVLWHCFENSPQDVASLIVFISGSAFIRHSMPILCMWMVGWVSFGDRTNEPKEVATDKCQINLRSYYFK